MLDPRFYATNEVISIGDVIALTSSTAHGEFDPVQQIATVGHLAEQDLKQTLVFVADAKYLTNEPAEPPAACFVPAKLVDVVRSMPAFAGTAILESTNPKAAFALIASELHQSITESEVSDNAAAANIHETAILSKNVVIGAGAVIGRNVHIGPNSFIGPSVVIGEGTSISSNVSITHAIVGKNCRFLSGAVVGEAGFGFTVHNGKQIRIPQLGRVIIGDEVEVGANTTIDRGMLQDTTIGNHTKIDNLVQIAHNVQIGERCAFAAQIGISGSAVIGNDVLMGGKVGIVDHVKVGDGATIMALSAPLRDVPPNEKWGGVPAKPARQWMRELSAISKLGKK